ncbi:Eukaryotic translation initiation factor eIF-1 [Coemansia aciculifera]|uniref:Eukaryotic translation initiation factor eIF-1 n=1 Tax=Coemansia aciculifera TaxID=417176 RepID=A0ACC1M7N2_9FUNG|nr:Eukaryotic translation initiation factor eIF-1 [Coemansia aciculifera]KAJ2897659.1 Eukaryotic translation initiation factor eIF-1 [Coemansia aciculifera]
MSSSKKAYETPSDSDSDAPVKPAAKPAVAKKAPAKSSGSKTAYLSPSESESEAPAKPVTTSKKTSSSAKTSSSKNVGFDAPISLDPFNDTHEKSSIQDNIVHIRVQQRNGRKTITTIQGLAKELDHKKIVKYMKKTYACNGTVVEDEEHGEIIQLQGDQRTVASTFLIEQKISKKQNVKIHGF